MTASSSPSMSPEAVPSRTMASSKPGDGAEDVGLSGEGAYRLGDEVDPAVLPEPNIPPITIPAPIPTPTPRLANDIYGPATDDTVPLRRRRACSAGSKSRSRRAPSTADMGTGRSLRPLGRSPCIGRELKYISGVVGSCECERSRRDVESCWSTASGRREAVMSVSMR